MKNIVIFGGYGFIGRELVKFLAKQDSITRIIIPVYGTDVRIQGLDACLNKLKFVSYDPLKLGSRNGHLSEDKTHNKPKETHIKINSALISAIQDADAVINLIGILNEHRPYCLQSLWRKFITAPYRSYPPSTADARQNIKSFEFSHHQLPKSIARLCADAKTQLIHISAQGVASGTRSKYLASKARGEQEIRTGEKLDWVIIRPGVVIGKEASFVRRLRRLKRISPIMPLPLADSKTQPVAAQDLLFLLGEVITNQSKYNKKTLNAVGPVEMSMARLVKLIAKPYLLIPIPSLLNPLVAWPMGVMTEILMINPIITRDNIKASSGYHKVEEEDNDLARISMEERRQELQTIEQVLN